MAYALNVGDIVEVTFKGSLFGQVVMNMFHYKYAGTGAIADGAGAMTALITSLSAANKLKEKFLACTTPEYTLDEIRAQVVHPVRQVYTVVAAGNVGTNAGQCTAPNVSAVIIKTPDQAGHGRTGSLHIPAIPSAGYVAGVITGAYTAILQQLGNEVVSMAYGFGTANTAQAIIWSRVKPTTPSVILGYRINSYVRTMHRRTVGLGI